MNLKGLLGIFVIGGILLGCGDEVKPQQKVPSTDEQISAIQNNPNLSDESKSRAIESIRQIAAKSQEMAEMGRKQAELNKKK